MNPKYSPFIQFLAMSAYIWICVGALYVLGLANVSENIMLIATLALLATGLWAAAYLVGIVSWAIATVLCWLTGIVVMIVLFG